QYLQAGGILMRLALRQRGQLLVAGIVLIVVIALMIATLGYLYVSSERSSTMHGQSDAAYFVARSGLEWAIYQRSQLDTPCDATPAGLARGANGTTAATHAAGINVFQDDQCLVQSRGTVGTSLRILEATVK